MNPISDPDQELQSLDDEIKRIFAEAIGEPSIAVIQAQYKAENYLGYFKNVGFIRDYHVSVLTDPISHIPTVSVAITPKIGAPRRIPIPVNPSTFVEDDHVAETNENFMDLFNEVFGKDPCDIMDR